jgi:hypothetical protein
MLSTDSAFDTFVSLIGEAIYAIFAVAILIAIVGTISGKRLIDYVPGLEPFTSPIILMTPPAPPFHTDGKMPTFKADLSDGLNSVFDNCLWSMISGNAVCRVGGVQYNSIIVVSYYAFCGFVLLLYGAYLLGYVAPTFYSLMNAGVSLSTIVFWHDLTAAAVEQVRGYEVRFDNENLLLGVMVASVLLAMFKYFWKGPTATPQLEDVSDVPTDVVTEPSLPEE